MTGDISAYFDGGAFDAEAVDTSTIQGSYDPLPPGWYAVRIESAEVRETKAGDGAYLHLELTVEGGPHANRKIWDSIMLAHPKTEAVTMGHARLALLARSVGMPRVKDSASLVGKRTEAKVTIGKREYQGQKQNEVREYRAPTTGMAAPAPAVAPGPAPVAPASAAAPAPAAAYRAASGSVPPWLAGKQAAAAQKGETK